MGWVVSATPRPLYPWGKRSGTHCIGGWVGPRAGLDGLEYLASTGIRPPDRPVRSKSLHQLSYPSPPILTCTLFYLTTVANHFLSARLTFRNSTRNGQRVCWMCL